MFNVNRTIEDAFYRYKMPAFEAKVEGRGNGIKTAIPNMCAVAKALDRPPNYVCKYLGVELGAQTQMYEEDERYIVNGEFEAVRFQDLLDGFIKKFVLCLGCGNPETKLRVTSKKLIESKCIACGHRCMLPMVHKLTTFIINNPPGGGGSKGADKKGQSKEERRAAKNAKANPDSAKSKSRSASDGGDGTSSADVEQGVSRANVDQRANGGKIDAPEAAADCDDDDEEWSVDVSEEAVRARTAELGTGVTHLTMTNDLEKSMGDRLEIFNTFVEQKKVLKPFPAKEIIGEAARLECAEKGVMVLVQQLWSSATDTVAAMKTYQGLFQRFLVEQPKAQMYALQAIEKLIEQDSTKMVKTPRFLKQMYDLDLVDDEVFVMWGEKPGKGVSKELAADIRKAGKAFLDWVQEAEEEESSEDENVAFESAPIVTAPLAAKKAAEAAAAEEEEDEGGDSDVDIDDM